jgi:hypothetical protein
MPSNVPSALDPFILGGPNEDGEYEAFCPLHDDERRSASFNFDKGVWQCFAGCGGGKIKDLIDRLKDDDAGKATRGGFVDDPIDLGRERRKRRGDDAEAEPITMAAVLGWHEALMSTPDALEYMVHGRGIEITTLERFKIGWDRPNKAYTIPIIDADGVVRNVRRHRPAMGKQRSKYWNVKGHGKRRLYPEDVLIDADEVVLCEGEFDALLINQAGIPAITATGGAGNWKDAWGAQFEGKRVTVLYDADETGVKGARQAAHSVNKYAREVRIASLPYQVAKNHGKDVTDFIVDDGAGYDELREVIDGAELYGKEDRKPVDESPRTVTLNESYSASLVGQHLEVVATVTGKRNPPYQIPATIDLTCSMDAGNVCALCPMNARNGQHKQEVDTSDPNVLDMLGVPNKQLHKAMLKLAGIPQKCSVVTADVEEHMNVEEVFVRPSIESSYVEDDDEYVNRKLLVAGKDANTGVNQTYRVCGTPLPNPKDQRSEFLSWEAHPTESSIDTFQVDDSAIEQMKAFIPDKGQSPLKKIGDIARDMEQNVTNIIGRPELHIAMDLVWHSALRFSFDGGPVDRGWLELLVVGDTRTGKSAVAESLMKHYGLGRLVSCEAASFAGIVGGLQQFGAGREWTITWGAVPINDRRLVVLDEISGLTTDQIAQMSSIRSSGIAQLTKIQQEQTTARTRLVWLGNPRKGSLADYTYAHQALQPLIGNPEDLARFDIAMSVATDDVPSEAINRRYARDAEHKYTSDACHTLIQWVWSRKPDQVQFTPAAIRAVLDESVGLGKRYVEDPPLIQAANVRIKLARLAVAIAGRTFSTDKTYQNIMVKKEHVKDAVTFLDWLYKRDGFGYYQRSKELIDDQKAAQEAMGEIKQYLATRPGLSKFLRSVPGGFRRSDMEDMMNMEREEVTAIINKLWMSRMVKKHAGGEIRIEPLLHKLLREVQE